MARLASIFLAISIIVSTTSGQCTLETAQQFLKRALYEFTSDLIMRINQETESHFVASGLSSWTLISSMSFGATDETLAEINRVLRLHPHKCFNTKFFEILQQTKTTDGNILERSSALFIDDRMTIHNKFKTDVRKAGVCDINEIPLEDSVSAAIAINDYVSQATHEAIDEIVQPSDLEGIYLVMIDALYFKGSWKTQFPFEDTEISAFYNHKGNQIGDANLMFVTGLFSLTSIDLIKAKVLELPYGEDSKFSMLIFLPHTDVSVTTVIENLKRINLGSIFIMLKQNIPQNVAVQLPRFKLTSDINNLKELLIDMGLRTMFDSLQAKFPNMSDYQVYVSNFIQKSDIEVTEEGTVASSVNEAVFESRMLPEQFIANKPFLFMIVDRSIEVPLFAGAYSKPSAY